MKWFPVILCLVAACSANPPAGYTLIISPGTSEVDAVATDGSTDDVASSADADTSGDSGALDTAIPTCFQTGCPKGYGCEPSTVTCQPQCGDVVCGPATPFCLPPVPPFWQSQCVQCLNDFSCPKGTHCESNSCKGDACQADAQCPQPGMCKDGLCFLYDCETNNQCSPTTVCKGHKCVTPECYSASQCTKGQTCVNYQCVTPQGCGQTSECPVNYTCLYNKCVTQECNSDVQCGGPLPYCVYPAPAGTPAACVGCKTSKDCATGEACHHNSCVVPECFNNTECKDGSFCGTSSDMLGVPAKCIECVPQLVPCQGGLVCGSNFLCNDPVPCDPVTMGCSDGLGCYKGNCQPLVDCKKAKCTKEHPACNPYLGCVECNNSAQCGGKACNDDGTCPPA